MLAGRPMRACPASSLLVASSWARARSKSASTGRNSAYMWVACSVGVMPLLPRTNSWRPSSSSSLAICMLSAGCTICSRWAARVTEPSS